MREATVRHLRDTVSRIIGFFPKLAPTGCGTTDRPKARTAGESPEFYRPTQSCQILELATLYRLFFGERDEGLFVEVGAYDGISFSNTSCLAQAGWHGILIEPVPEFAKLCRDFYRGNQKITVIEAAVGSFAGSVGITVAGMLTSTDSDLIKAYRNIEWAKLSVQTTRYLEVEQRTLDEILNTINPERPMDLLVVDVEGAESSVFAGFSIERWRPKMMIVELTHTHPDLHAISKGDARLQRAIESAGYSVVYKDSINTVFVSYLV